MFKKLVVGALATGIALTGGIGAASHAYPLKNGNTMNFRSYNQKTLEIFGIFKNGHTK
ncbi:hypothetical protein ACS2CR_32620 [Bacillus cereus group sp. BceL291]|uniref:hypothetical protein n=1 Tax=Bacillus cereus group sp. BceL291 TaxID=3444993 RepID=UPI003F210197